MKYIKRKLSFRADRLRELMQNYPEHGLRIEEVKVWEAYKKDEEKIFSAPDPAGYTLAPVLPRQKRSKKIYISAQWLADKTGWALRTTQQALALGEILPEQLEQICIALNVDKNYLLGKDEYLFHVQEAELKKFLKEKIAISFGPMDSDNFIIPPYHDYSEENRKNNIVHDFLNLLADSDELDGKIDQPINKEFLYYNADSIAAFIAHCLRDEFNYQAKKAPNIYFNLEEEDAEKHTIPRLFYSKLDNEKHMHFLANFPASYFRSDHSGGEDNGND